MFNQVSPARFQTKPQNCKAPDAAPAACETSFLPEV